MAKQLTPDELEAKIAQDAALAEQKKQAEALAEAEQKQREAEDAKKADLEAKAKAEALEKQKQADSLVHKKQEKEAMKEVYEKNKDTLKYLFDNLTQIDTWYVTSDGSCFETLNAALYGKAEGVALVSITREEYLSLI